jgi:cytochrome c-type biogenesis protein CcmH/NrfG
MPTSIPSVEEMLEFANNRTGKKIEELKEVVRKNPKDLEAWVKLGNIYAEHRLYREAAEAYSQSPLHQTE